MKNVKVNLLTIILFSIFFTACGKGTNLGDDFYSVSELRDNLSKEWAAIDIMYDYDMQSNSWTGDYYELINRGDHCQLIYHDSNTFEEIYCDFSVDIYNEMVDLVLSNTIEEYTLTADEHGKIIYDTVPYIMKLYWSGSEGRQILCKAPENIAEIISKFEELKQYAQE